MPHKDRAHHEQHRPSPALEPQVNGLPPIGGMRFSDDGEHVQCHVCGKWMASLNSHLRTHVMDKHAYKETYEIGRGESLLPPAVQERYRAARQSSLTLTLPLRRRLSAIRELSRATKPRAQEAR
jgi:predicted transcriptional regulator